MDLPTGKDGKVPFEEALEKTGYGLYNYLMIAMAGLTTISFVTLAFGSTIIVPASACELETTTTQQGLLVAVPVFGAIVGTLLWGYLGDTRGRRRMLLTSLMSAAVINALASLSVNWIMLMIVQLVTVTLGSGIYVLSMTLSSESVPLQKRNVAVLLVSSVYLLGPGLVSLMAVPIIPLTYSYHLSTLGIYWNSWRTLQVVYSCPSLVCAIWLFFMQESPKYALARGDEERALKILRKIHRTNNGKRAEELQVKGLLRETGSTEKKSSAKDQIVPLFKQPYLKYTLIMACLYILYQIVISFLVWAPTIANQFMQVLETGEGSDYTLCQLIATDLEADSDAVPCSINQTALLLVFGVCALHSVFNTVLSQVVDKAGRRNLAMAISSVCGVGGIIINLVPNAIGSVALFMFFSIAVIVSGFYTSITVALFPTHLRLENNVLFFNFDVQRSSPYQPAVNATDVNRTMAVATTMIGGRIMSVAFIQLTNYLLANSCELGFYIFCVLFSSSALILALLPDDRRLRKPQKDSSKGDQHEERTSL